MSMTSQIDVCNLALARIGHGSSIAALTEASAEAAACSLSWPTVLDMLLAAHPWSWARREQALPLLAAAAGTSDNPSGSGPVPPTPWHYQYAMPPACLTVREIKQAVPGGPDIPFLLSGAEDAQGNPLRILLTDQPQATLIYTARVQSVVMWSPHFVGAMVTALAAAIVQTLTGDRVLAAALSKEAAEALIRARVADGTEDRASIAGVPDWLKVRGYAPGAEMVDALMTGG